jgi:membrane protein YqaA with SNARE-associated domain
MNTPREKTKKFLSLVTEAVGGITKPGKAGTGRDIAILTVIILCFMGLSFGLLHLFPNMEEFARYGYIGVFLATLLGSATIIVPAPGIVVILAAATFWNPALVAVVASVGGTLGELTAYYVGRGGRAIIISRYQAGYEQAEYWMNRYGGLTIFLFALIPVFIFDLVGVAAGTLRFPVQKFVLFCWLGRLPRSFMEAYLGYGMFHIISPVLFP